MEILESSGNTLTKQPLAEGRRSPAGLALRQEPGAGDNLNTDRNIKTAPSDHLGAVVLCKSRAGALATTRSISFSLNYQPL